MVSDIDSTVQFLKENNIRFFKEPREEPFGKHAIIEDPDGHLISIAQLKRTAIRSIRGRRIRPRWGCLVQSNW